MKQLYLGLLLLFCVTGHNLLAQQNGFIDVNGDPFILDQSPFFQRKIVPAITLSKHPINWQMGSYTDTNGVTVTCKMKFYQRYLVLDSGNEYAPAKYVYCDSLQSVTMANDSFFTINGYVSKKKVVDKPILVKYLGEINGVEYAERRVQSTAPGFSSNGGSEFSYVYYVKPRGELQWKVISHKRSAITFSEFFASHSLVTEFIRPPQKGKSPDGSILMYARYYFAHKNGTPLWLDKNGNLSFQKRNHHYRVECTSFTSKNVTLQVFENNRLYANFNLSNIVDFTFNGTQTLYHSNAMPKWEGQYKKGEALTQVYYAENGDTNLYYTYAPKLHPASGDTIYKLHFPTFNQTEVGYARADELEQKSSYVREFQNGANTFSYRMENEIKVYQPVGEKLKIKKAGLDNNRFVRAFAATELDSVTFNEFKKCDRNYFFVLVRVNEKGEVITASLLSANNDALETYYSKLIDRFFVQKNPQIIKPFKVAKKKVHCEFVVPVQLNIRYSSPARYPSYDPFFMNQFQPSYGPSF